MKKTAMIVAVAGLAAAVQAAPIESVTFTSVNSSGRQGGASNEVRTATFTSASVVKNLTISGTLSPAAGVTNTWAAQAMVLVQPPGGDPFIIQPFTQRVNMTAALNVPANSFSAPVGTQVAANAGTWTFTFFESCWDTQAASGADSVWDTLTITLDDADPTFLPLPSFVDPSIQFEFANINSNISWNAAIDTHAFVTFSPTQSTVVDTVVVSGIATGTSLSGAANTFGINVNGTTLTTAQTQGYTGFTPTTSMLIRVLPPGQLRSARFAVNPASSASSTKLEWFPVGITAIDAALYPAGTPANVPTPANSGEWKVEFLSNLASPTTPAFTAMWNKVRINLVSAAPPAVIDTITLADNLNVDKTGTFAAPGEVKWYKVIVPAGTTISRTNGNAFDVGMVGTSLTVENDACFGLYNNGGAIIATSFNTGPGFLPQISFGTGIRNAVGDGVPFDGANPGRSPAAAGGNYRPDLAAGNYFLAVVNGDDETEFRAGLFSVNPSNENNTGPYTVNFRSWTSANSAPFDVPVATDLGTLNGATVSQTADMTGAVDFKWYKFTLSEDANDTTTRYVDIDTANTAAPLNDTNIALYDSAGNLKSLNDDISTGWTPETNPTGGNSAMSFGNGVTTRDYTAINANLPIAGGADGPLTAGTYYLQVSPCCATYANNRFWVINDYATNPEDGTINVNIRHNYPAVGSACGPADIGTTGGTPGFDNLLNNNDFIVFIDQFFAGPASCR